jgi:hypothetical protein
VATCNSQSDGPTEIGLDQRKRKIDASRYACRCPDIAVEARSLRWEPTAWRDLLWAAADKGDPALQFELAESLLEMPETTLAEMLEPAASWLQKRRETLKGEPPDDARFLRVWDRLAVLVYPPEAVPPMQAERDLVTTALNDPADRSPGHFSIT